MSKMIGRDEFESYLPESWKVSDLQWLDCEEKVVAYRAIDPSSRSMLIVAIRKEFVTDVTRRRIEQLSEQKWHKEIILAQANSTEGKIFWFAYDELNSKDAKKNPPFDKKEREKIVLEGCKKFVKILPKRLKPKLQSNELIEFRNWQINNGLLYNQDLHFEMRGIELLPIFADLQGGEREILNLGDGLEAASLLLEGWLAKELHDFDNLTQTNVIAIEYENKKFPSEIEEIVLRLRKSWKTGKDIGEGNAMGKYASKIIIALLMLFLCVNTFLYWQIKSVSGGIVKMPIEISTLKGVTSSLGTKIDQVVTAVGELKETVDEIAPKQKQLSKDITVVKTALPPSNNDLNALFTELQKHQIEVDKTATALHKSQVNLGDDIEKITRVLGDMQSSQNAITDEQEKVSKLVADISTSTSDLTNLLNSATRLEQTILNTQSSLEKGIADLKLILDENKNASGDLQEVGKNLQEQLATSKNLLGNVDSLQVKIQKVQQRHETIQGNLELLFQAVLNKMPPPITVKEQKKIALDLWDKFVKTVAVTVDTARTEINSEKSKLGNYHRDLQNRIDFATDAKKKGLVLEISEFKYVSTEEGYSPDKYPLYIEIYKDGKRIHKVDKYKFNLTESGNLLSTVKAIIPPLDHLNKLEIKIWVDDKGLDTLIFTGVIEKWHDFSPWLIGKVQRKQSGKGAFDWQYEPEWMMKPVKEANKGRMFFKVLLKGASLGNAVKGIIDSSLTNAYRKEKLYET